jgi:hypothetical protein
MEKDITSLFNKFAGKELRHPNTYDIDPVQEEMAKIAKDNGLRLRVWFPGSIGTCDYDLSRVNVHVNRDPDGKYRIKSFSRG